MSFAMSRPRVAPSTSCATTSSRGPVVSRAETAAAVRTNRFAAVQARLDQRGRVGRVRIVHDLVHQRDAGVEGTAGPLRVPLLVGGDAQRRHRLLERDRLRLAERGEVGGEPDGVGLVDALGLARGRRTQREDDRRLAQPRVAVAPGVRLRRLRRAWGPVPGMALQGSAGSPIEVRC